MKVIIDNKISKGIINYPCLMKSVNGRIMLMTSEKKGTVVNNYNNELGRWADDWFADTFKPFDGSITIEND